MFKNCKYNTIICFQLILNGKTCQQNLWTKSCDFTIPMKPLLQHLVHNTICFWELCRKKFDFVSASLTLRVKGLNWKFPFFLASVLLSYERIIGFQHDRKTARASKELDHGSRVCSFVGTIWSPRRPMDPSWCCHKYGLACDPGRVVFSSISSINFTPTWVGLRTSKWTAPTAYSSLFPTRLSRFIASSRPKFLLHLVILVILDVPWISPLFCLEIPIRA